jgi:hypothetical protein
VPAAIFVAVADIDENLTESASSALQSGRTRGIMLNVGDFGFSGIKPQKSEKNRVCYFLYIVLKTVPNTSRGVKS